MLKNLSILFFLTLLPTLALSEAFESRHLDHKAPVLHSATPQCFWMENYSGKFEWVPANTVYQRVLTKEDCFNLDSCDGGKKQSGGGCYKWAVSGEEKRIAW